jgi:TRAP-type C4-dicarboxylate transport system permease small subunit
LRGSARLPAAIMFKALARIHNRLTDAGLWFGAILLGVIFVAYCWEVLVRYVFSSPTTWSIEVVVYSQCAGIFVTIPYLAKVGAHVAVTIIVDRTSREFGERLSWFIYLIGFVMCAILTWMSLDENIRQVVYDVNIMAVHSIPKWWISVFMTYGFGMSALHYLRKLNFRTFRAESISAVNIS